MKFDFVIGNPPYQQEQESTDINGSSKNYAPPVYNLFMDAANEIADKVELIENVKFFCNIFLKKIKIFFCKYFLSTYCL